MCHCKKGLKLNLDVWMYRLHEGPFYILPLFFGHMKIVLVATDLVSALTKKNYFLISKCTFQKIILFLTMQYSKDTTQPPAGLLTNVHHLLGDFLNFLIVVVVKATQTFSTPLKQ